MFDYRSDVIILPMIPDHLIVHFAAWVLRVRYLRLLLRRHIPLDQAALMQRLVNETTRRCVELYGLDMATPKSHFASHYLTCMFDFGT